MIIVLTFLTFCFFIALEPIVREIRPGRKTKSLHVDTQKRETYQPISESFQNIQISIPKGLFVSRGHVWVKVLTKDEVKIGLDDFCPRLITKIDRIKLHNPGDRVNDNGGMCTIYQEKKKLTFYSPLDGIIKEANIELLKNPKIICCDPFGKGWIYRIKPSLEISYLGDSKKMDKEILDWEHREVDRLANFILSDPSLKIKLEEKLKREKFGIKGLLDSLDSSCWLKFEENFLR